LAIAGEVASAVTEPLFEREFTTRFEVGLPFPATQLDKITLLQKLVIPATYGACNH
jgi:hypothetical protein